MKLFREIVQRVWKQKVADREHLRVQSQTRMTELENRKRKLLDALLDGRISQTLYNEEIGAVGTAIEAMVAAGDNAVPSSQKLECLLQFAEWMMDRLAGLWNAVPLPLKVRLQAALFPNGIMVSQERFGTGLTPALAHWWGQARDSD